MSSRFVKSLRAALVVGLVLLMAAASSGALGRLSDAARSTANVADYVSQQLVGSVSAQDNSDNDSAADNSDNDSAADNSDNDSASTSASTASVDDNVDNDSAADNSDNDSAADNSDND